MKVLTWNVNGIRTGVLPVLKNLIESEDPDFICIQETKITPQNCQAISFDGYDSTWTCSLREEKARKAYAGTLVLYRTGSTVQVTQRLPGMPEEYVDEGRFTAVETEDYVICNVYVPNSGTNQEMRESQWDAALYNWVAKTRRRIQVILVGDLNVIATADDVWWGQPPEGTPKETYQNVMLQRKRNSPGSMTYEMDNFRRLNRVLYDTWRVLHPDSIGYTWYDMRTKARETNRGYRIDYIMSSEDNFTESRIIRTPEAASDHLALVGHFDV